MCDVCDKKAQSSARLAAYFRQKACETELRAYADTMTQAADSLAEVAAYFASRCRCNDRPDDHPAVPGISVTPFTDRFVGLEERSGVIFHS